MTKARIASYNDLIHANPKRHIYGLNFGGSRDNGSVRIDSNDLAHLWYCQFDFMLSDNWRWGRTTYDGKERFLSNIKIFRFWNPGPTKENVYVELTGYLQNGRGEAKLVVENERGQESSSFYFFQGFKDSISKNKWHRFSCEFMDSSDLGAPDGYFKFWFDSLLIFQKDRLITKFSERGLKRPFIIGFSNVWEAFEKNDYAPNDFLMTSVYAGRNETFLNNYAILSPSPVQPIPAPEPEPEPEPEPKPAPAPEPVDSGEMPAWFKKFIRRIAEALHALSE